MKKIFMFGLAVLLCGQVKAGEWWTDDTLANTLTLSANALFVIDWAQTREIADNPNFQEGGTAKYFIGTHPTTKEVNSYFVGSLLVYNAINYFLPTKYKRIGSSFVVGYELNYVAKNIDLGISIKF